MPYNIKQNEDGSTSLYNETTGTEVVNVTNDDVVKLNGNKLPKSITFSPAAGGSNVSEITITVKDGSGTAIAAVHNLDVWLSDASTGAGLTATTASGAVAAKASNGTDLATLTSKKALRVQTLATGVYILSITDTSKTGFYVCAQLPGVGKAQVSSQLQSSNYG